MLRLENLSKDFGDGPVVDGVDLVIERGEIFSLLGGSGSGKTTLLRMIAGFEAPSFGRVVLDGEDLTAVKPYRRPLNMMFQSYALFPHMSVAKNVAYGLVEEGWDRRKIDRRVEEVLDLVKLEGLERRKPHQLSGGQRQRVALARAIAKKPKLLLLDEPLSALDRGLRDATRSELVRIQRGLGVTFVVVTHDQDEAMTMSDRLAVMDRGKILQIGPPKEVYDAPASRFTATFLGVCNLFDASVEALSGDEAAYRLAASGALITAANPRGLSKGQRATLAVRPEHVALSRPDPSARGNGALNGRIAEVEYVGHMFRLKVEVAPERIVQVYDWRNGHDGWAVDQPVALSFDASRVTALTR